MNNVIDKQPTRVRPLWSFVLVILMLTMALTLGCSAESVRQDKMPLPVPESPDIWFEDIDPDGQLSPEEGELLASYVADKLFNGSTDDEALGAFLKDSSPRIVFVSVSDGGAASRVIFAQGVGVLQAIEAALSGVKALSESGFQVRWLKFDIVQDVYRSRVLDPRSPLDGAYERDLFGLAFDQATGLAFLPGEILGHTLIDREGRIRFDNIAGYVLESQMSSEEIPALEKSAELGVYRFSTLSYFSMGDGIVELYRNHRFFDQLPPDDLLASAIAGADYLSRAVGPDGKFVYIYYPKSDIETEDYNILRHAGTIYAMLEVYEYTQDQNLLEAVERAINYLMNSVLLCEADGQDAHCIVEDGEAKLGGNGLAVVALAKYTELTGDRGNYPVMVSLGNWIRAVQSEAGEFTLHKMDYSSGAPVDFISDYYPGEALLALMRLYALDGDQVWLEAAERGAEWLITVRDFGLSTAELEHDHWLLYALNEIYRHSPRDIFIEHAFIITDAIMSSQNRDPQYPDWLGSYYQPPRSTPTATRSEGLFSTYLLARDHGYDEKASEILEALRLNIAFQLQTQFRPESVIYLKDPQRSLGGFHRSLDNYELRIDYTQHNISSLLGLYEILVAVPAP